MVTSWPNAGTQRGTNPAHPSRSIPWEMTTTANRDADTPVETRADDQTRPVDFGSWMLGPRRTYHLKVSEI